MTDTIPAAETPRMQQMRALVCRLASTCMVLRGDAASGR
jgi:hypothetical protein